MAKKYYWLKLKEDFFNQPKIKKLRSIPGGSEYTIIYLKMQLMSLKNEGVIYFEGVEDTFAQELSLLLDESIESVEITLNFLKRHKLLEEYTKDEFSLPETISSIGKECDSAERVRKYRQNNKKLQCNANVTECNTEIEKRDREKSIDIDTTYTPYQKIIDLYNEICVKLPKVIKVTENRKKSIQARFKEYGEDIEIFRTLLKKQVKVTFFVVLKQNGELILIG